MGKVALAKLLWMGTTVSQGWIAERLGMGSAANVSQQLSRDKTVQTTAEAASFTQSIHRICRDMTPASYFPRKMMRDKSLLKNLIASYFILLLLLVLWMPRL